MSDPKFARPLHRRPVRVWIGFLTGLLFGSLGSCLLVLAPTCKLLGPYPPFDVEVFAIMAGMIGTGYGLAVGLAVPLLVLGLQHWKWWRSEPRGELWRPEQEGPSNPPGSVTNSDERISRRNDIAGPAG